MGVSLSTLGRYLSSGQLSRYVSTTTNEVCLDPEEIKQLSGWRAQPRTQAKHAPNPITLIRAWANQQADPPPARGPLPDRYIEAWLEAHAGLPCEVVWWTRVASTYAHHERQISFHCTYCGQVHLCAAAAGARGLVRADKNIEHPTWYAGGRKPREGRGLTKVDVVDHTPVEDWERQFLSNAEELD